MKWIIAVIVAVVLAIALGSHALATPAAPDPAASSTCEERAWAAYDQTMAQADAAFASCTSFAYVCHAQWLYAYAAANITLSDSLDVCYYLPQISGGAPIP